MFALSKCIVRHLRQVHFLYIYVCVYYNNKSVFNKINYRQGTVMYTLSILALKRQRQADFLIENQSVCLNSKLQASQGYLVRFCLGRGDGGP